MKIHYQEHDIESVMRYFASGFAFRPPTAKLVNAEWFIDITKSKVVFKLYLEEQKSKKSK